jgi:hypothetical protein
MSDDRAGDVVVGWAAVGECVQLSYNATDGSAAAK